MTHKAISYMAARSDGANINALPIETQQSINNIMDGCDHGRDMMFGHWLHMLRYRQSRTHVGSCQAHRCSATRDQRHDEGSGGLNGAVGYRS